MSAAAVRTRGRRWRHRWHSSRCAVPGCGRPAAAGHHVVYRQHLGPEDALYEPANCLPLCTHHHMSHHGRSLVLPVSVLDDGHIAFAFAVLGEAAVDYLSRYYVADQPWRLVCGPSAAA